MWTSDVNISKENTMKIRKQILKVIPCTDSLSNLMVKLSIATGSFLQESYNYLMNG